MSLSALRHRLLGELPQQTLATFVIRTAAVGLEFLCLLVLARVFKASAYGTYALVMSCIAIVAVPAAAGMDRLLVREIAAFQACGDWEHVRGLLRRSAQTVLAGSILVALATALGAAQLLGRGSPDTITAIRFGAVLVPVIAFARLRQAALQGFGQITAGQIPEAIAQPVVVIVLAAVVAFLVPVPRTATVAVILQLIGSGVALLLGVVMLRRHLPAQLESATARYRTRAWWITGIVFTWLVGMTTVLTNADTVLVGALMDAAHAGSYKVASQLAAFVGLPLTAVSVIMAPTIASLHSTGRIEELRFRVRAAARIIMVAATGITLMIAAVGYYVLAAFGPGFTQALVPALILAAAYWVHSAMATSSYLLFMTSHERLVMLIFSAGATVGVIANVMLIRSYGMLGAAVATGASLCLVSVTCALMAWWKLRINATVFSFSR